MSYVDQLLIKKTIRLVRGADGGHKTDRNGIFSAIFSTFKEGPDLVEKKILRSLCQICATNTDG